jgi:hypothetical protein
MPSPAEQGKVGHQSKPAFVRLMNFAEEAGMARLGVTLSVSMGFFEFLHP